MTQAIALAGNLQTPQHLRQCQGSVCQSLVKVDESRCSESYLQSFLEGLSLGKAVHHRVGQERE